ncbi:ADP-ribosylation factor-like protein 2-like protein [Neoconidiobolus thromboides FSU 785]|nr:ADP-ribosylation factor-like protein 2-like protein [Neoconidiobolus thromboides FSU 785]
MGMLTLLKKIRSKEKEMRILVLGLDNAGKTSILKKLNGEPIDSISPTLGFNILSLSHKEYKLNFWDVGGQVSLRSYWKNYFEGTEGLIWVVDASDKDRLIDTRIELNKLLDQEKLSGITILILANKQDISGALSCQEISKYLELDNIDNHHWKVLPCSALTGQNLFEGIDWLILDIASRIYVY